MRAMLLALLFVPLGAAEVLVTAEDPDGLLQVGVEEFVLVTISESCGRVFASDEKATASASGFPSWMLASSNTIDFPFDDCDQSTGRVEKQLFLPINATTRAPAFTETTLTAKGTVGSGSDTDTFTVEVDYHAVPRIGVETQNLTGVGWFNLTIEVVANGPTHLDVQLVAKPEGVDLHLFDRFWWIGDPIPNGTDTADETKMIQAVVDPSLMRKDVDGNFSIFPEFSLTFQVTPSYDDGKWLEKGTTKEITLMLGPTDDDLERLAADQPRDAELPSTDGNATATNTTTSASATTDEDGFVYTPPPEEAPLPVIVVIGALAIALLRRR